MDHPFLSLSVMGVAGVFGGSLLVVGILHVISSAVLGFGGRKAVMSTPAWRPSYWQAIRNLSWAKSNANEHHVVQGMYVRDKGIVPIVQGAAFEDRVNGIQGPETWPSYGFLLLSWACWRSN